MTQTYIYVHLAYAVSRRGVARLAPAGMAVQTDDVGSTIPYDGREIAVRVGTEIEVELEDDHDALTPAGAVGAVGISRDATPIPEKPAGLTLDGVETMTVRQFLQPH